jgi:hypothetical protein
MDTFVTSVMVRVDDPVPEDDDVVAGPWGALVFVFLIAATVLLLFSFTKQLRKTQAAKEAGVFGEPDATTEPPSDAAGSPPERSDD